MHGALDSLQKVELPRWGMQSIGWGGGGIYHV